MGKPMALHWRMLFGVVVGAGSGLLARLASGSAFAASLDRLLGGHLPSLQAVVGNFAEPVGKIWLRSLFVLVIPLIFSALVVAISEIDLGDLGRLGAKTFGYTVVVSTIAVAIGLFLVNVLQPGASLDPAAIAAQGPPPKASTDSAAQLVVSMFPDNFFKAAAGGDMIGVILFALLFGVALLYTKTAAAGKLRVGIQGVYDVMMTCIDGVMWFAPVGVGALLFAMTAKMGGDVFWQVGRYVAVVLLGLGLHMFVVYSLSVWVLGRMNPLHFFRSVWVAIVTAFSTASSAATLPTALKVAEENLKLPRHVSRFVLTAGSTMNQNGTALFEGVTVLFLAQVAGKDLTFGQQALVMGICILAGIGTAGVPAGSLPVIAMILGMMGIPPEGLGLILGVDRLLDMSRTTLNVTGDLAAAVFVARGETGREGTLGEGANP